MSTPDALLYFDEVFDERGAVRPPYEEAVRILLGRSRKFIARFPERSRRLTGDMPLTAMPRIFSQSEYAHLVQGTAQRARAIAAFLEDYLGAQTFRDRVIPGSVLDAILARTGEGALREAMSRGIGTRLRAFFAPDVIRAPDGGFCALEDNVHCVGGPGDLEPARAAHERLLPGFAAAIGATNEPVDFLSELVARCGALADPPLGPGPAQGAFVVYGTPPYDDEEDIRLYKMLEARGAVIVEPGRKDRKIKIEADGAYLVQKIKIADTRVTYRKKIGFLWMNAEYAWVDWKHPLIFTRALVDEARLHLDDKDLRAPARRRIKAALRPDPGTSEICLERLRRALKKSNLDFHDSVLGKSLLPGLVDLILQGKIQTNATPGVEFLGDKMFYSYVPELIRFYLKEEPAILNIPTLRLFEVTARGALRVNKDVIAEVMQNRERYVIKVADGRGGDGVFIGPKMTDKAWRKLEARLLAEPTRHVVQRFIHPSVLSDPRGRSRRIVDSRFIAMILDGQVFVSGTFMGRSNMARRGDGKVNLSLSGTETVGYIVPDAA